MLVDFLSAYSDIEFIPYNRKDTIKVDCSKYKFKLKPYKHQMDAIEYGVSRDCGWMLLDEMGLGKTAIMIYMAEVLRERENLEHCFIICGVNSLKYNWASEIEKFSNLSYTILGEKISKKGKRKFVTVPERVKLLKNKIDSFFIITNIETLQHKDFANAFNSDKNKFDLIVLDEAHRCKNPTSKSAKTLLKLKAKRCVALTGTIIMNVPENAYVPLKWTGNTNSTFSKFKNMFNVYGGFGGVQVIGNKNLDILQDLISSCSLRRLKSDVIDLPKKVYKTEYVEMSKEQQELYNQVEEGIASELDKLENKKMTIIQEIAINTRLRQVTASPSIVSTTTNKSAKLDRLEELVEGIVEQGDKVVVFCTFKGTALEAYDRLSKYNPLICTGDTKDDESSKYVYAFQNNEDNKVFIGTWQKCGTGITLTKANYLIFIDTPWTDADFQQAADRIYRIGQDKPIFIITLITKDTYDERVKDIIDNKRCLSGYLVDKVESDGLNIFENA